ncbi:MAG: PAS domain S-box protein [Phycisphaerae bacterium]
MSEQAGHRVFHSLGNGCAIVSVAVAAAFVLIDREQRSALADQVHERVLLKMHGARAHIEDHMTNVWLGMKLLSSDPAVAALEPESHKAIQALFDATFSLHHLNEIYVVDRYFDGSGHPFLSLARDEDGQLAVARHSLDLEREEYAVHVEQIRRFLEDPSLEFDVSQEVQLCIGRPGVVCSVPIRPDGQLVGIVAGMIRSRDLTGLLEVAGTGDEMILTHDALGCFSSQGMSEATRHWFRERFDEAGADRFFAEAPARIRFNGKHMIWENIDVPGSSDWYLAYVYDEANYLHAAGLHSAAATWGSATIVVILGGLLMGLCRLIPALSFARSRAQIRAEELAAHDSRTRAIVNGVVAGVITIDSHGVVDSFNPAAERIFGYTSAEVIGNNVRMLMPPPDRDQHDGYLAQYLRTGISKLIGSVREVHGMRKDGTTFPIELDVSEVILPGGQLLFTGIVRDIGERKRAEEALRLSEDRYRTLVQNIDLGVTLVDSDFNIIMTNQAQGRLFDKPASEFVGKKCYREFEKREAVCAHCPGAAAMASGRSVEVETEGVRDDGSRFSVHIRAFPLLDADGEATRFIEVVEDITERKRSERDARVWRAELAHANRLGMMGEMAATLAHELNQPLAAIMLYVESCLARIRANRLDSEELLDDMTHAVAEAERAGGIIEGLRQFLGKERPRRVTVDINRLVRQVVNLMMPEITQRGVTASLELAETLPLVEVEEIQVQQVLVNLMKNGIDAMSTGRASKRRLIIRTAYHEEGVIECAVQDTGTGLKTPDTDQVFEPFFTGKANGMGMGLPISRRIIEAHNGRLWASSPNGTGATFHFTLAVKQECKHV